MAASRAGPWAEHGILVGVDGSEESLAAVGWATAESVMRGCPVTMMHVVSPMVVSWPIEPLEHSFAEWQDANARKVLDRARQTMRDALGDHPEPPVRAVIRHDGAVPELAAASANARLLVLGSRGLGPIGGVALGSVSRSLLHHARCPVAVVKAGPAKVRDRTDPVLLGIDGSPASEAATAFAFDEASRRGVGLVALHAWCDAGVFPVIGSDFDDHERAGQLMLTRSLAGWQEKYPHVKVRQLIVCDRPARWLIDESRHAQLVVVGARGRGGIDRMLMGSVSTSVAELASAPVVAVRDPEGRPGFAGADMIGLGRPGPARSAGTIAEDH